MNDLKSIRQGKHFEIEVDEIEKETAVKKVNEMCKKLLVNEIIEDYKGSPEFQTSVKNKSRIEGLML